MRFYLPTRKGILALGALLALIALIAWLVTTARRNRSTETLLRGSGFSQLERAAVKDALKAAANEHVPHLLQIVLTHSEPSRANKVWQWIRLNHPAVIKCLPNSWQYQHVEDLHWEVVRADYAFETLLFIKPPATSLLPAATRALESTNELTRFWGARILGTAGDGSESVLPVLRKALAGSDSEVKSGAVSAIEILGPKAGDLVPELSGLLRTNSPSASGVARALGRIGEAAKSTVPDLERIHRETPNRNVRWQTALAVARLDAKPWAQEYIVDELRRVAVLERPANAMQQVGEFFDRGQADFLLPVVTAALDSNDLEVYGCAVLSVAKLGSPTEAVLEKLHERMGPDGEVNIARDVMLVNPGDETALRVLTNGLHEAEPYFAIDVLGMAGPSAKAALPQLRALQNNPNPDIRKLTALAIRRIEGGR